MKPTTKMIELASKYNYFQIDAIPQMYFEDAYFAEHFDSKINHKYSRTIEIPEFILNSNTFQVAEFCHISEQFKNVTKEHESYFIERFVILVYCETANEIMLLHTGYAHKNKYYLHPIWEAINKLQWNTPNNHAPEYVLKTPNYFSLESMTEKKLLNWVNYCNDYLKILEDNANKHSDKKEQNLTEIQKIIHSLPNAKVSTYHDTTQIETNLFTITLTLENKGSYLSQKVQYKGTIQDIINNNL